MFIFKKETDVIGWKQQLKRWLWKATLYFFILSVVWVLLLKWLPIWVTPTMIDRKIEAISQGKNSKIYADWTPYNEISREMALAVVASEDQSFPNHFGFDFDQMYAAFRYNLRGDKTRGASTISQQVAKNVFLWQDRSYIRKALEIYFTALIEIIWGKKRILEVYLNIAETANMTFGAEAAAQRFYGKPAKDLTRSEATRIAAVLPSPRRFFIKNPSNYVQARSASISRRMAGLGGKAYISKL